eukprot:TRINITY_DN3561_c0_g1_i3.p1 TRINITY_DN3561_c0_g1~~TRINITY_DN3561_c0_g1_i3.p1  ORF type:complete len:864 (-),score=310.10 TRINITY_DN3561_c0_g1_i3:42-2522(-)
MAETDAGLLMRKNGLGDLSVLSDQLILATIFSQLDKRDLIKSIPFVSKVFYIFGNEEFLWKNLTLNEFGGDFIFQSNWKVTALTPRHLQKYDAKEHFQPKKTIQIQGFSSNELYYRWYLSHLNLNNFQVDFGHIERKNIKELTFNQFVEEYDGPAKIVMLKGVTDGWLAKENWTREKIVERYGHVQWKISHKGNQKMTMNLKDYLHYSSLQNDEAPLYVFDSDFGEKVPEMLKDYKVHDFFKEDYYELLGESRPKSRWIVLGPQRSGSPWHTDPDGTSAWNSLIKGRKRWAFYPPHIVPPGLTLHPNGRGLYTDLDAPFPVEWFYSIYPTLLPHQRPMEVTQEEGETIYVPRGWWHIVVNLEDTIAVTQNFVNQCNVRDTLEELSESKKRTKDFEVFSTLLKENHPEYTRLVQAVELEKKERDDAKKKRKEKEEKEGKAEESVNKGYPFDLWLALQKVCAHHSLEVPQEKYEVSVPPDSTNRVFLYNDTVFKFFSNKPTGPGAPRGFRSFEREKNILKALQICNDEEETLCPELIGTGRVRFDSSSNNFVIESEEKKELKEGKEGSEWKEESTIYYVISSQLEGEAVRDVFAVLTDENVGEVVDYLAQSIRKIHECKQIPALLGGQKEWKDFLTKQNDNMIENHTKWTTVNLQLIDQMKDYIGERNVLLEESNRKLYLLHGDLNDENLIGVYSAEKEGADVKPQNGTTYSPEEYLKKLFGWETSGIIDFGDALLGDPIFDLVALHVSVFRCDKRLLKRFLDKYGSDRWTELKQGRDGLSFAKIAMCYTLWHPCDALKTVYLKKPHFMKLMKLEELERALWDLSDVL